ncbi:MAG: serine/threonine-protein kinase, partial [Kofleriaceae bacterium]
MGWYCPRCGQQAELAGTCPRDGDALAPVATHDLLGRKLGEYTVLASLGGGAFGNVYRAVHGRSGLIVAIKLLHRPIDDTESSRVLVEARAAAMLSHPNVVQVYDLAVSSDRRPYIVMQHLEGRSLAKLLEQPITTAMAMALARDILSGLAVAHARGIIHRDLKPDNVFVASGRAIIVDFGLAKLVADPRAPSLTITGEAIGTPAYMAPEQIRGKAADGRADLYAVGCVLFEALTGKPPFEGLAAFALFDAHLHKPVPSVRERRPEVPEHVDAAIAKALAKDPADRHADATAMQRALATPVRRRRARWPFAAVGAIAAVAVVAVVGRGDDAPPPPAKLVIPALLPGEVGSNPSLEDALVKITESLELGSFPRATAIRMRCEAEAMRAAESQWTPPGIKSYARRIVALVDQRFPGIDPAKDCAAATKPPKRKRGLPPPLAGEPALSPSLEASLREIQTQLEAGRFARSQVVALICALYKTKDSALRGQTPILPELAAFHRRYELLLRRYFPDL